MAVYIAGYSVLEPTKSLKRWIRKRGGVRKLIKNFLKRDSRFDVFHRTGKHFASMYFSMPSYVPLNSIYWPTGAKRFAIGIFLVSEMVASAIFSISAAQSNSVWLVTDNISGDSSSFSSHCFNISASGQNEPTTPAQLQVKVNDVLAANQKMADYSIKYNLMPLQVVVTQRSWTVRPFDNQTYFATWMIPLFYVPLYDSDYIVEREQYNAGGIDGFGILVMVDQRFLWQLTPAPTWAFMLPNSNDCYFSWYKQISLLLKAYVPSFQWEKKFLDPYGRRILWDDISDDVGNEEDPCQSLTKKRERRFDDDRALFGVPVDLYSSRADLSLAEFFGLIEQSLSKKLLFHPNWQIEFVNPLVARFRMLRNMIWFTPRVVYLNKDLYTETQIPEPSEIQTGSDIIKTATNSFLWELPYISGGLAVSIAKTKMMKAQNSDKIDVDNTRITESPEPRHMICLPHVIEVVGNLWLTPEPDKDKPDLWEDAGSFTPFGFTYYRACLVPEELANIADKNAYEFLGEGQWFYYDEFMQPFDWWYSAFVPGTFMALTSNVPIDMSIHRIYTTHLCIVATEPQEDISISNPKEESKTFMNKAVSVRIGRKIVRDWLGWYAFPFTWEFGACSYWPLTGYEDYMIFRGDGRTTVVGHQSRLMTNKQGTKYVGWESPQLTFSDSLQQHILLDSVNHVDGSGESPVGGSAVTVSPGS